ncbi:ABC transporter substrate-binding protein [Arcobacter sp. FWKO B]|uniref:ABC transporter substrate-binding protein n=1 Tax=Arcobacter sp. FWKO B TaxID=2593672 RepID=UPI0018A44AF8|nr:ABC transporter substrate-binding protein [Arcobacter sp. FWKO B]QOG11812.1 ABC transporter substrate-binding protein [Arcobacter sp. FWKO B]
MIKSFYINLILLLSIFSTIQAKEELVFGTSLPMNGIMQEWGDGVISGANSYFYYTNDNNILQQYRIKLIAYDDKYEPDSTYLNTKKLITQDKVFGLFGFVGTPTVKNILSIINDNNTPFIAPFTGAMFLRDNHNPDIINLRTNYYKEIKSIVNYLHNIKHIDEFSVFYQNDDYGHEGYTSLLKILKLQDLKLISEGTYKRNTLSINHAINEIKESKPKAIIMIGAHKANSTFIKKARLDENFKNTIFAIVSFGDADAMIKDLDYESENLIFSQIVPSYNDTTIPIVKQYRKIYSNYYPNKEYSFISLEAFIGAKIVVDSMREISGKITQKKFIQNIKQYKNSEEGIIIEYKNKQLLNKVYLFEYTNFNFKEIIYDNQ